MQQRVCVGDGKRRLGIAGQFYGHVPSNLDVAFADVSTGNPTSWSWDFGDGSPLGTGPNPSHTYASAGTYTVTLTASNNCSSGTYQQTITVEDASTGTHLPGEPFGLKVYPNPAADLVNVEIYRHAAGPVALTLTDATGRMVLNSGEQSTAGFILRTGSLAPGVYYLRISTGEGAAVRK